MSLQDDLALRFDSNASDAADTLARLRSFHHAIKDTSNKFITGTRSPVVYEWIINEYHHPSAVMKRQFSACVPST